MKNKKDTKNNNEEDIVFEDFTENTGADHQKKLKKIKEELKKCQEEKAEYLDGWQRAKADFVNFKKNAEEDRVTFKKYANEDLIMSLLPTLDNFEAALKDHGESEDIKKWKTGFEHIYSQLKRSLESVGLEQINPLGEQFDPNFHESVEVIESEDNTKDGEIAEVVMKGYKIGEKVLRAPQVKVFETQ